MDLKLQETLDALKNESIAKIKELGEKLGKSETDINTKVDDFVKANKEEMDKIKAAIEKAGGGLSLPGLGDEEKNKKPEDRFSFQMAYKGMLTGGLKNGEWSEAGYEKEVIEQTMQKAQSTGSGSTGGFLVAEEISAGLIPLAIAKMPIMQMGVTRMTGLVGDIAINKATARPTGFWVGENDIPTESNITYDQRNLRPKRVAGFTIVSKRLILQSRGVVEQFTRQELANGIALAWHQAMISGKGSENEPKGLNNYSDIGTTTAIGATGGRFRIDKAGVMEKNIDVANMLNDTGSYGYLMRPEVRSGLRRERADAVTADDARGMGLLVNAPIMSNTQLEAALGYMVRSTTQLSATVSKGGVSTLSRVYFGDWSQFIVGEWAGLELKASDVAGQGSNSAFLQDQVWLLAQRTTDFTIKDETGFTRISDADTDEANW